MSVSETINILYSYRQRLKHDYESPGWNFWVLSGALASLVWVLLSLLEDDKLEFYSSISLLIALIFIDFSLTAPGGKSNRRVFYIRASIISFQDIPSILFIGAIWTSIIIYTNWYSEVQIFFKIPINVFCFLLLVSIIAIPLIKLYKLPIPIAYRDRRFWVIKYLFPVLGILSAIGFLLSYNKWHEFQVLKSGFIFFGIYYVTRRLLKNSSGDILIDSIDSTIDELTFGKIDVPTAMTNLKLVIYGLEFNDIMRPIIQEHFELDKKFQSICTSIGELMEQFNNSNQNIRSAIIDSIEKKIHDLDELTNKLDRNFGKINKHLSFLSGLEKDNVNYSDIKPQLVKQSEHRKDAIQKIRVQIHKEIQNFDK